MWDKKSERSGFTNLHGTPSKDRAIQFYKFWPRKSSYVFLQNKTANSNQEHSISAFAQEQSGMKATWEMEVQWAK